MNTTSNLETDFMSSVFFSFAKPTYEELLLDMKSSFTNMNLITIYFCFIFIFFGNDLKNYMIMVFKYRKLYAVIIFFGMAEHYYVHEGRSGYLTISLVLCFYGFFMAY